MTIGERIREKRVAMGLTQEELAKRIGYQERFTISKIERGQPIKQKMVVKLANALNTTPSYLMGWTDEDGNDIENENILESLYKAVGVSSFTEEETKLLIDYAKYLISKR